LILLKGMELMNKNPQQIKDVKPIRDKQQIEDMKFSLKRFCSERDYILFLLGINSGLRIGDLLKLKVKDVKKKKVLVIQEGKTSKPRTIYLESVYAELNAYINTIDSEWLFPSRKGDKPISSVQAYRQLNKASEMVDITEGIGTHTLRKTFGYWHYNQFKDVAKLQMILNHSHPQITLTYIGITEEQIENDMKHFKL
jgi:integrase